MKVSGASSPAGALTLACSWLYGETTSLDPGSVWTDWSVSTPPPGSESLVSTSTRFWPPAGSIAMSFSAIGVELASRSTASTRMIPIDDVGPSETKYVW